MIPIAGSAYTYSYATMGELVAWIIGWDLILEYAVGAATVAIAWSEYFNKVLEYVGLAHPVSNGAIHRSRRRPDGVHGIINIPAIIILARSDGAADSRHRRNRPSSTRVIVITKVAIVLLVIVHRLGLHQPGQSHAVRSDPDDLHDAAGRDASLRRRHGHSGRRRRRVLRLHRLRRGVDRGAGSQEPEARHADRHPGLAGHLHGALRAVLARAERRRDGRGLPDRGQGSVGRLRDHEVHDRLRVAGQVRDGRHSCRVLVGDPGHAAGAVARVLLDEPRRPGAEDLLRGAPEVQDAVEVEHAVLRPDGGSSPASSRRTSSAR